MPLDCDCHYLCLSISLCASQSVKASFLNKARNRYYLLSMIEKQKQLACKDTKMRETPEKGGKLKFFPN